MKKKESKRTQLPPLEHSHPSRELNILPRNKEKINAEKPTATVSRLIYEYKMTNLV